MSVGDWSDILNQIVELGYWESLFGYWFPGWQGWWDWSQEIQHFMTDHHIHEIQLYFLLNLLLSLYILSEQSTNGIQCLQFSGMCIMYPILQFAIYCICSWFHLSDCWWCHLSDCLQSLLEYPLLQLNSLHSIWICNLPFNFLNFLTLLPLLLILLSWLTTLLSLVLHLFLLPIEDSSGLSNQLIQPTLWVIPLWSLQISSLLIWFHGIKSLRDTVIISQQLHWIEWSINFSLY